MNKIFENLIILDIANNHFGSLEHGKKIIGNFYDVCRNVRTGFQYAIKLQYRNLDTFIHPGFKDRLDYKLIKRFTETRLSPEEYKVLKDCIKDLGFLAVCTPFDEQSVDLVIKHDFDIIKVASCSFTDWPLLEQISKTNKPVILSTAGASMEDIDNVVLFMQHRQKDFAIMHCVGEYPTPYEHLDLNQIDLFKKKYPDIPIGFSTHEEPKELDAVKIAIGKGASILERHIGIEDAQKGYKLNGYSSNQEEIKQWLNEIKIAKAICGGSGEIRRFSYAKEVTDLRNLKRGVFAKTDIKVGEKIALTNTFLSIPNKEKQVLANDFSKYMEMTAKVVIETNSPIMFEDLNIGHTKERVEQIIGNIKKIITDSKLVLPEKVEFELSHHFGLDKFERFGCVIFNCINREYCKKILIVLPGQKSPTHYHKLKEETFQILYGNLVLTLDGAPKGYKQGDNGEVERGVKHSFSSRLTGSVIEEVSTTHYVGDSYYIDETITANKNRKTNLTYWTNYFIM